MQRTYRQHGRHGREADTTIQTERTLENIQTLKRKWFMPNPCSQTGEHTDE